MSLEPQGLLRPAGLIYGLEEKPSFLPSLLAAFQHLLASLVPIVAPTLIIGHGLGLEAHISYLVSMALMVSGVATFIQSRRIGPVGSGLLSLQGTSFAFVGAILAAGFAAKARGASSEEILALIFGLCLAGCLVEVVLSQFVGKLRRVITPTTTGIVITVVGLSLIEVSFNDLAGLTDSEGGTLTDLALGVGVVAVIVVLSFLPNRILRMGAILLGSAIGLIAAALLGLVDLAKLGAHPLVTIPTPLKFGLDFDVALFLPIAFIYVVTAIEATGDLTANSVIAGEPIEGELYLKRIQGGILGDGVNSGIAAFFGSFPNTTFGQNNGVIQMTGIASRHIALYIAPMLILIGLFPVVGEIFLLIPKPILGAATLIMFGSIAVAGIRILASEAITRKRIYVMALSFGFGLGVVLAPDALQALPEGLQRIFGSAITVSGLVAIVTTLSIPDDVPAG